MKLNENIIVAESQNILTEDEKTAETLNSFFSSAGKNLNIPEYNNTNPLSEIISHPNFKSIMIQVSSKYHC